MLFRGVLGHEIDEDLDNGFRPPNLIRLSKTEVMNTQYIQDHGSSFDSGSGTHHLTLYRAAPGGGIVFGSGSPQWSWALDGFHDAGDTQLPPHIMNPYSIRVGRDIVAPDHAIQQFTVNLFSDLDAHATSVSSHPHLVFPNATADTDDTPPTCEQLVSVELREESVWVTVSASDSGGGVVAAVEIALETADVPRWVRVSE